MKHSVFAATVIVALIAILTVPVFAAAKTPNLEVHIYLNPDLENQDLDIGVLDINDWPLAKEWIETWTGRPDITMRSYSELGMFEFDFNNQRWPTGNGETLFYDAGNPRDVAAKEFRKAIAFLTDKTKIIAEIVKGFGIRLELPSPMEAFQYVDIGELAALGLITEYDQAQAIATFDAAGFQDWDTDGTREWWGLDLTGGTGDDEELPELIFYIRMDDPLRRSAGELLTTELQNLGIPVKPIVTERTVCYKNVMVLFDYHIYTGGWINLNVPDTMYDFFHSDMFYGPWCPNYCGFAHAGYDALAYETKYPNSVPEAKAASQEAAKLFLAEYPSIPLWSAAGTKAYKTGWTGVVNNRAYGVDGGHFYTFLSMEHPTDDTIDYGFKSDIEQLNAVSSEWAWDHQALGLIYDAPMGRNPFTNAFDQHFAAESHEEGTWDNDGVMATEINLTLRSGLTWHDGTPVEPEDYEFTIDFQIACGSGVAWGYSTLMDVHSTDVIDGKVRIRFNSFSIYSIVNAAGQYLLNKDLWGAIKDSEDKTWTDEGFDFMAVREYDPMVDDADENGVVDIKQDGTGPYMFENYVLGSYISYTAFPGYIISSAEMDARIAAMFHAFGDVDENGAVGIVDVNLVLRAMGTTPATGGTAGAWGAWNAAADLNENDEVYTEDLLTVGVNFGGVKG